MKEFPESGPTKARDSGRQPVSSETRESNLLPERELLLVEAINGLLEALDACGGDPPDCPHCGPARAFARQLVAPESGLASSGKEEAESHPDV